MIAIVIALHEGVGAFKLDIRVDALYHSGIGQAVHMVADVRKPSLFTGFADGAMGHLELYLTIPFPAFFIF